MGLQEVDHDFLNIGKLEQHEHDDQMKSKSKTFIRCY